MWFIAVALVSSIPIIRFVKNRYFGTTNSSNSETVSYAKFEEEPHWSSKNIYQSWIDLKYRSIIVEESNDAGQKNILFQKLGRYLGTENTMTFIYKDADLLYDEVTPRYGEATPRYDEVTSRYGEMGQDVEITSTFKINQQGKQYIELRYEALHLCSVKKFLIEISNS